MNPIFGSTLHPGKSLGRDYESAAAFRRLVNLRLSPDQLLSPFGKRKYGICTLNDGSLSIVVKYQNRILLPLGTGYRRTIKHIGPLSNRFPLMRRIP